MSFLTQPRHVEAEALDEASSLRRKPVPPPTDSERLYALLSRVTDEQKQDWEQDIETVVGRRQLKLVGRDGATLRIEPTTDGSFKVDFTFPEAPGSGSVSGLTHVRNHRVGEILETVNHLVEDSSAAAGDLRANLEAWDRKRADVKRSFDQASEAIMNWVTEQRASVRRPGAAAGDDDLSDDDDDDDAPSNKPLAKAAHTGSAGMASATSVAAAAAAAAASSDGTTARRKTFMQANADLSEKLQLMREDPDQLDSLRARINDFRRAHHEQEAAKRGREARGPRLDIVESNLDVKQHAADVREAERRKRAAEREQRRTRVAQQREQRMAEQSERRQMLTQRRELREERERLARESAREYALARVRQMKWLMLVEIGARHDVWGRRMADARLARQIVNMQNGAASIIQRNFRFVRNRKRHAIESGALIVINRVVQRAMLRRRRVKKIAAADCILQTLKEMANMAGIVSVVKSFRQRVTAAQGFWRQHLWARQSRIELLCLQWGKYEPAYLARKQRDAARDKAAAKGKGKAAAKGKGKVAAKGKGKVRATNSDFLIIGECPHDIKVRVLGEYLGAKQRLYADRLVDYLAAKKEYQIEAAKRAKLAEMSLLSAAMQSEQLVEPVRPYFRVLAETPEAMLRLIDRGYRMYSEERTSRMLRDLTDKM